jgi:3'(2'), 5'-bisphosphate nucleotidase
MKAELETAKSLALQAGEILLKHYAEEPSIKWKGQNDPVTAADLESSRFLVDELRARFPNDAILCEEEKDDLTRLRHSRVWLVDPMDGTKEFIAHRGEFAAMIGLAVDGEARLGVVYQPTQGKLYYGVLGEGAHVSTGKSTLPLKVSVESDFARAVMAMSRSHPSRVTEAIRKELGIEQTIRMGSIGIKIGLLCEAQAHVYVQGRGTSLWDTCGPEAILRAAGGTMTDRLGNPIRYDVAEVRNLSGVIATNGVLHDRVVEVARAIVQQYDARR